MRTEATTQAAATQREKEDVARQARDRAAPEQAEHFRAVLLSLIHISEPTRPLYI